MKHRIAIYDKTSRTISYKSLNLEDDQDFISTFGTGDYFFADYLNNSRKTGCTYGTARLAKDKGGALEPTPVFSLKKGWMKGISLTSPDGKMHATVLKADIRKESSRFYVYVYDMDGTEVYHKAVIPSISGNHMQFEGAFLSNTGEGALSPKWTTLRRSSAPSPTRPRRPSYRWLPLSVSPSAKSSAWNPAASSLASWPPLSELDESIQFFSCGDFLDKHTSSDSNFTLQKTS